MNDSRNIRYFLMQHELNPSSKYFLPLADLYIAAGRLDEAGDLLESGLELHPGSLPAQLLLGICRQSQGRIEEAVDLFEKVACKDPRNRRIPDVVALPIAAPVPVEPAVEFAEEDFEDESTGEETVSHAHQAVTSSPETDSSVEATPVDESTRGVYPGSPPGTMSIEPEHSVVSAQFLTSTLADIYLAQNHREKALKILYQVLAEHPDRNDIAARIAEIEAAMSEKTVPAPNEPPVATGAEQNVPDTREKFDNWMRSEMES